MSSSISSSERLRRSLPAWLAAAPDEHDPVLSARDWTRFSVLLIGSALAIFLVLYAAIVVLDPYDSGRFSLADKAGPLHKGPRMAQVSRARNQAFDFAIFGNSHVQLLSPERLGAATGLKGVSLMVPATGPREQFRVLEWYLAHRTSPPKAVVIGVDHIWCRADADSWQLRPFPFWLYSLSRLDYLVGLVRMNSLEDAVRRLQFLAGRLKPERADGYWDYEENRTWNRAFLAKEIEREGPLFTNRTGRYPAAEMLAALLRQIPAETKVVLIHPPAHISHVPAQGTPEAAAWDSCRAAFAQVAAARPGTTTLDFMRDDPDSRADENWFDTTHYRQTVARRIEAELTPAMMARPDP